MRVVKRILIFLLIGIVLLAGIGFLFINRIIDNKVQDALGKQGVRYAHVQSSFWEKRVVIDSVKEQIEGKDSVRIERLELSGVDWVALAKEHRLPKRVLCEGVKMIIPGMHEEVKIGRVELAGKTLTVDTLRVFPTIDKLEIGRKEGHQTDCIEARVEGITLEELDVPALLQKRLIASSLSIEHNHIYVFRDRRLPLKPGVKPMPVASLKSLPVSLRIGTVKIGASHFAYEEYPKTGDKTGTLTIVGLKASLTPLINHPEKGDPAYIHMVMSGSLEGSGTVESITRLPLHEGDPYEVEGAFHDLDVTKLNSSAENLGQLHLESGLLNSLSFKFNMTEEKSSGEIIGEYHDLVVDKLKLKDDQLKVDKLKTFALKKLIIPKDKDKSLPVSKRTGKVDYRRDRERYFPYYMLHSLLTGVKSSFRLGFLLPG